MLEAILSAAACVAGIGLICAVVLVVAAKFMAVRENALERALRECLPGVNCGACGYTGCDGYAKVLAEGTEKQTNLCIPGGDAVSQQISEALGVEFQNTVEQVAVVHCCGDCDHAVQKADYMGVQTCSGARMLYGGQQACTYGCLGKGDCAAICPYDAIYMEKGIAHVCAPKCVGCGLCVKTCPNGIISLIPDTKREVIACSNEERGARARKKCTNACIACGKCEKICPTGAIAVEENLARIDYDKCIACGKCAQVCPVGCILSADRSGRHRFSEVQ